MSELEKTEEIGDKIKICLRINRPVWKEFLSRVASKHGRTYGVVNEEIENAIRLWLKEGSI